MNTSKATMPTNNLFDRDTYRPGDGEVIGSPRPGSQDALALPSLMGNRRTYRDGRVVPVVQHQPSDDIEWGEA